MSDCILTAFKQSAHISSRPCVAAVLLVIPADAVADMLENFVPSVMRATGSEKLSWLDENRTMVQAMEDMAIPNSAGLTVSKVRHDEQSENTKCCSLKLISS